jgi:hypothetical protein
VVPAEVSTSTPSLSLATAMLPSVEGWELVKFSVSPVIGLAIVTVALDSTPPLSTSLTVSPVSSATGDPPPSNVTVAPAVTVGFTCTVSRVLVTVPELSTPSLTDQSMVRVVSLPPPVGSLSVGLTL